MTTLWFTILALMLAIYVVLDGFDFGAGILHLFVAKTDVERRTVFAAIGPVWDGNEVWLIAAGGTMVFAFPRVYAAGFSGYYLPLMMVLWLLILRGTSIEFRSHEPNPLWRSFWDGVFAFSSILMAIVLGAALGTIIRGVPLDETGYFRGPLFTNLQLSSHPGILDWYTVLVGVFALIALSTHGALYLVYKTTNGVRERCLALASRLLAAQVIFGILATIATAQVRPELYHNLLARPWTWVLVPIIVGSLGAMFVLLKQKRELPAFLASACFLLSLLGATVAGLYPKFLISTISPAYSLDIYNASTGTASLRLGLLWWPFALLIAVGYFVYLFHSFRGKVALESEED